MDSIKSSSQEKFESKEAESVPVKSADEYKGENFDTIEGAWDYHSRSIPETVYCHDELNYLFGEEIMFKRDFEAATKQLLQFKTNPIEVIKKRIEFLKMCIGSDMSSRISECNDLLKLIQ